MIMKGQKRKHPPEEVDVSDRSSPMWESQRQFVFSVSLNKYHHSQGLPEPSLRRSVLIANTLRQVSLEAFAAPSVDMEASPPPCSSSSGLLESVFTAKHHPAETFSNSHSALLSSRPSSLHWTLPLMVAPRQLPGRLSGPWRTCRRPLMEVWESEVPAFALLIRPVVFLILFSNLSFVTTLLESESWPGSGASDGDPGGVLIAS
ncbi:SERTA domain-containing protein 3 isoform X2 [Eleginops maclovinus]|uniref:SERTA domain-containing protein 3 isoform X2 n=1 Tax=Eleginops maclovinus TaxID=56733 RepID=UPI0030809279